MRVQTANKLLSRTIVELSKVAAATTMNQLHSALPLNWWRGCVSVASRMSAHFGWISQHSTQSYRLSVVAHGRTWTRGVHILFVGLWICCCFLFCGFFKRAQVILRFLISSNSFSFEQSKAPSMAMAMTALSACVCVCACAARGASERGKWTSKIIDKKAWKAVEMADKSTSTQRLSKAN